MHGAFGSYAHDTGVFVSAVPLVGVHVCLGDNLAIAEVAVIRQPYEFVAERRLSVYAPKVGICARQRNMSG